MPHALHQEKMKSLSKLKHPSIETLRALAVVLVFIHHLHSIANITLPYIAHFGGWVGVQIFFVISGYLIILSALRYSAKDYVIHRVFRIYPAYLFWFIAFAIFFNQLVWMDIDFKALLIHLTFLQHLFPGQYFKYDSLHVSWTLTIELVWYFVAFLCAARFKKNPAGITLLFMVFSYVWIFWGSSYFPSQATMEPGLKYFFVNNNFINQLPFFFFGAYIAVKNPRFDKAGLACIFLVTVVLSSAWKVHFPDPIFITGFGIAALFLILKDMEYANKKYVVFLSEISYSFYLIHFPIITIVSEKIENHALVVIISIAATLGFSYLSYRWIEQPFMRMAKRKSENSMLKGKAADSIA